MARGRVKMNSAGSKAALTESGLQKEIQGIVSRAESDANGRINMKPGELFGYVGSTISNPHTRAGGRVTALGPSARRDNGQNNTLMKVIGGAR